MGPFLGGLEIQVEQKIISVVLVGFTMQSFFSRVLDRSKDFAVVSWANKWITFQIYK